MNPRVFGWALVIIGLAVTVDTLYNIVTSGFTALEGIILFVAIYVMARGAFRLKSKSKAGASDPT